MTHPGVVENWHTTSNTLILLAVTDEEELGWLCAHARAAGLRVVRFHEPDLDDSLTAAALEPAAYGLVAHLPLALGPGNRARTAHGSPAPRGNARRPGGEVRT